MKEEVKKLKRYFINCPDVIFAFLFGSQVKEASSKISDWDIAVYFKPKDPNQIEWEETERDYPEEDRMWDDLVDILKTDDVDLVVLNRAPSNIAAAAIRGVPLIINDHGIFLDFLLKVSPQAEDYREFVDDYYKISERPSSLLPEAREKLERIGSFLKEEMSLYNYFSSFDFKDYQDIHKRHEVERWVENMINSAIDIGEIILASEKKRIPDYYKDVFVQLGLLPQFSQMDVKRFTRWVKLCNILAHEYLDIKWRRISDFVKDSNLHFRRFLESVKEFLK
jgi:uncharacterized protein YutE (UPF0331/DUF86 family)/predicted nucleotidyltransferase